MRPLFRTSTRTARRPGNRPRSSRSVRPCRGPDRYGGTGVAYIGHNRLRINADGSVSWFERNVTGIPTAPVDPTASVVRVDRRDSCALAVLTQYACHPVVFGSDNLQSPADFPGVMNRVVEEKVGAHVISFFLQGTPRGYQPVLCRYSNGGECCDVARLGGRAPRARSRPRRLGRFIRKVRTRPPLNSRRNA